MLKFQNLLFNKWILSALANWKDPKMNIQHWNPYKLHAKLWDNDFFLFFESNPITSYNYWRNTQTFFMNFPNSWNPRFFEGYLETTPIENRIKDDSFLQPIEWVVLRAFQNTTMVWLYLPIFLTDFFKYYPCYKPKPFIFEEIEFEYLDCWIQILPVFQDFLGHLLVNDTPLVEQGFYGNRILPMSLMPPLEKDINFSAHIREFYFGEDSIPEFRDVIILYLNNRLELKTRCEKAWAEDNQLDNKIPVDLAEYFISCFLLKGISKYTLRFVVANLDLSNKNITKVGRDAFVKEWNSLSGETKKEYWPEGWLSEQKKLIVNMLKFQDLLFNKWIRSATATFKDPNDDREFYKYNTNPSKLTDKLSVNYFFLYFKNTVITSYDYWEYPQDFFRLFPYEWRAPSYEMYLEMTPIEYIKPIDWVLIQALKDTLLVWLYLPIFLTDFFKYYPFYKPKPLIFEEIEFEYLDCWIQILPVFQDFLGHFLVNDTPWIEPISQATLLVRIPLMPPLEKDINFSAHIREFYFGENSIPEFKDIITLYLNNRLELKARCEKAWAEDNHCDNKIPVDLVEYFISCFLLKGISKYTLRFVVANLDLSNKNPMKVLRDASVKTWKALPEETKKIYWPAGWRAEQPSKV